MVLVRDAALVALEHAPRVGERDSDSVSGDKSASFCTFGDMPGKQRRGPAFDWAHNRRA
jgi:hypothetical protein